MLEKIYQDFTEKVLPKVAEGFSITKDYFFDLFGRYIKYLIITDTLAAVVCLAVGITSAVSIVKAVKWFNRGTAYNRDGRGLLVIGLVILIVLSSIGFFLSLTYLVQDFYVPEIRVYQQLKPMMQ